jgi:hypothetical protein
LEQHPQAIDHLLHVGIVLGVVDQGTDAGEQIVQRGIFAGLNETVLEFVNVVALEAAMDEALVDEVQQRMLAGKWMASA